MREIKRLLKRLLNYQDELGLHPIDIMRATFRGGVIRWVGVLVGLVFVSAMAVVIATNANREAAIQHNALLAKRDQLHTQWSQLLIEYQMWTNAARVSKAAHSELNMQMPNGMNTHIIALPSAGG